MKPQSNVFVLTTLAFTVLVIGSWAGGNNTTGGEEVPDPCLFLAPCEPVPFRDDDSDVDFPVQFSEIAEPGLGDPFNSKAWGMAWWQGRLYVSTARAHYCVETAVLADEGAPGFKYPPLDEELTCTPQVEDLPLAAEIWRYTPPFDSWERVFVSPEDVPIPGSPGKFTARDAGFRNLLPFTDLDGTQALYAFGVTSEVLFGFEEAGMRVPPRILRTTDGVNWAPVPQDPGTVLGDLGRGQANFRAAAVFRGRLYVVVGELRGGGSVLEASDPAGGNNNFQFVTPSDLKVYEMAVFNDLLYVGTDSLSFGGGGQEGYVVAKTDATGPIPYTFDVVIDKGAYRQGLVSNAVVSMFVYDPCADTQASASACGPHLYIGTDKPAELVRLDESDQLELIVGKLRLESPFGPLRPLSGFQGGYSDPLNEHIWRMQGHDTNEGRILFVGTNDLRGFLKGYQVFQFFLDFKFTGFDLAASFDGIEHTILTRTGFGGEVHQVGGASPMLELPPKQLDVGIRVFASTPWGLFFGTSNPFDGLRVYKDNQLGGDVDKNGQVDELDIALIQEAVGGAASGPADRRDLNGDGRISEEDLIIGLGECTNPRCRP
ncbi:MAG: dockerin type I repeat-containing protein [Acidobacteriota bacterium]